MQSRLTKLMNKYESDKGTTYSFRHGFSEIYNFYFNQYEHPRILEIGVASGGDIMAINDFFDGECEIVGADIDTECGFKITSNINYHFYNIDQSKREELDEICQKESDFDIIIDDGSHIWEHQMLTLYKLFPKVKRGGIYILEDLHTSLDKIWSHSDKNDFLSPLEFILGFNGNISTLTEDETNELRKQIKDVIIFSKHNIYNQIETTDFQMKSITAIITFK